MTPSSHQPAVSHDFSAAFERMCNFVAIAQTKDPSETRRELILQCFVILPDEQFKSAREIVEAIDTLFGLQLELSDVEDDIDHLIEEGYLSQGANAHYRLDEQKRTVMQDSLDATNELEERVRNQWFAELAHLHPQLPHQSMWDALRRYLAFSFRRHGLQAVTYLDPKHTVSEESLNGLNSLLKKAVEQTKHIEPEARVDAADAISDFLAAVGEYPDRVTYIAQLADGTFNYFSLTVDPEVAQQFRENLERLVLFLDTNFLFGVLDLHANSFVEVSIQILEAVTKHKLPFTLRYHAATREEFEGAIQFHGDKLRSKSWSQAISRAATRNRRTLSGIELKYHSRNAESPIDVDSFLKPYEHFDVLLKDRGIDIYRATNDDRRQSRADLLAYYSDFLASRRKDKPTSLIDHDVTVVDTVLELRERASSTVKSGALLLTCDYTLYRFDQEMSRRTGRKGCVLLPNVFMQMLRPFIPSSADFDRSFAETFAIPEFRIIGSGAARATSRLMGILASYREVREETAVKLLSNDLLLDRLEPIEDDAKFQELVEAAIIDDNNMLMEEKAALERQIEEEKRQRLQEQNERLREREVAAHRLEQEQRQKREALETAERERLERDATSKQLEQVQEARRVADEEKRKLEAEKDDLAKQLSKQRERYGNAFWLGTSVLLGVATFILLQNIRVELLDELTNPFVSRGLIGVSVFCLVLGTVRPKWRSALWGIGVVSIALLFLDRLLSV
jgi:phage terminase small subunit